MGRLTLKPCSICAHGGVEGVRREVNEVGFRNDTYSTAGGDCGVFLSRLYIDFVVYISFVKLYISFL